MNFPHCKHFSNIFLSCHNNRSPRKIPKILNYQKIHKNNKLGTYFWTSEQKKTLVESTTSWKYSPRNKPQLRVENIRLEKKPSTKRISNVKNGFDTSRLSLTLTNFLYTVARFALYTTHDGRAQTFITFPKLTLSTSPTPKHKTNLPRRLHRRTLFQVINRWCGNVPLFPKRTHTLLQSFDIV